MSYFVKATPPPRPKTQNVRTISLVLAVILIGMAVTQLFTFEKFPDVIKEMWLPGGDTVASIRAALIVVFEVGAVPFLLFMRLSPAMRFLSMVFGWLAIAAWFAASMWQNIAGGVSNSGLLGATVKLPVGWWNVLFCVALGILAAWAAWGMWPLKKRSK